MYLEILDSDEANVVAVEVNQLTSLLKNVDTLPINVIEEQGKFYVKSVDQFDYSRHNISAVLPKLPSETTIEIVSGALKNASDFGAELKKIFTAENIALGISQTPGAVAGVIEAMNRKYLISGCKDDGISLNDVLNTNSLSVGPEVIDFILTDMQDNPQKFAGITTWINPERLNKYRSEIIAYLS